MLVAHDSNINIDGFIVSNRIGSVKAAIYSACKLSQNERKFVDLHLGYKGGKPVVITIRPEDRPEDLLQKYYPDYQE